MLEGREGGSADLVGTTLTSAQWDRVLEADFSTASFSWFKGAKLNVTENCLDRHVAAGRGDAPALTWEADDGASTTFSYRQVLEHVSRIANVLRAQGVRKGDPVTIVMPMVPDLAFAILACARIGAPHSVIFGASGRIQARPRSPKASSPHNARPCVVSCRVAAQPGSVPRRSRTGS